MINLITVRNVSVLYVITYTSVYFYALRPWTAPSVAVKLVQLAGYFFLPLMCIWYGDELEEYVGISPGPTDDTRTPGWILKLGGWFLLFLPAVINFLVFRFT